MTLSIYSFSVINTVMLKSHYQHVLYVQLWLKVANYLGKQAKQGHGEQRSYLMGVYRVIDLSMLSMYISQVLGWIYNNSC